MRRAMGLDRGGMGDMGGSRDVRDIVEDVLDRTTGPVCPGAERRLHDFVTSRLVAEDAELVALHLTTCRACRALAEVMSWAPSVCREIAFVDPPAGFTRDVLVRTGALRMPSRIARRALRAWRGALRRPRLPLELGYAGALGAALLVGTPAAPLRPLLPEAVRLARVNPVEVVVAGVESTGVLEVVVGVSRRVGMETARRAAATAQVAGDASSHAKEILDAALAGDVGTVSVQLGKVGGDLERLLHVIRDGVAGTSSHSHEEKSR